MRWRDILMEAFHVAGKWSATHTVNLYMGTTHAGNRDIGNGTGNDGRVPGNLASWLDLVSLPPRSLIPSSCRVLR